MIARALVANCCPRTVIESPLGATASTGPTAIGSPACASAQENATKTPAIIRACLDITACLPRPIHGWTTLNKRGQEARPTSQTLLLTEPLSQKDLLCPQSDMQQSCVSGWICVREALRKPYR